MKIIIIIAFVTLLIASSCECEGPCANGKGENRYYNINIYHSKLDVDSLNSKKVAMYSSASCKQFFFLTN